MKPWKNILIGLGAAVLFSFFYLTGLIDPIEERFYDFALRFRIPRKRIDNVVFLNVDDNAIAYNGVFPWPRSVTAEGLLRLKEYGARAAIFDIEFIDKGPQGVDGIYLSQGLPADFDLSFSEINNSAQELFSALQTGRLGAADIGEYAGFISEIIRDERDDLFRKAQGVARDNDRYLAQASALFGKSWVTLNLREVPLTDSEQAGRRPMAEKLFSYPVQADAGVPGGPYVDILPALPSFAEAAKGAGFTNVEIDSDGIRRRIYLLQNIYQKWYAQLAFAPLLDYLGGPAIELKRAELLIKGARLPEGEKDIRIPLDSGGRMMLDWPRENYFDSYGHVSFVDLSLMDNIESEMEQYSRTLAAADISFFAQFDPSLAGVLPILAELRELFDAIPLAKTQALENCSGESFAAYVDYRAQSRALIGELIALEPAAKVRALAEELAAEYPESAALIRGEAKYISDLGEYLAINLEKYEELNGKTGTMLRDKFCILGRVDTGTTDIGVNPFWGEYVNVGTHAVVLDTILSESFIIPLGHWWSIIVTLLFVPLFFALSLKLPPLLRAVSGFAATAFVALATILALRFTGYSFAPLGTLFAMVSAVIIREIISYSSSEREKLFIREAFSTYVSSDVVKEIISDPSRLQLGGVKRMMSALFTDVQGFSTISEKVDPEDLVSLLNRYLTAMSDVVLNEKGTIDKYEGDAIIAFFGAPLDLPDHPLRACVSALAMKRIEGEMNQAILAENMSPAPLLTRFGINTGYMVAGNMGTENKMNYTIMGNAVNLAARLEGVNKQYGTWILASEDTVKETGDRILYRRLDRVRVVGIHEPVRLCNLLETAEHAGPEQKKLVEVFHQALDCFEKRDWIHAIEGFRETLSMEERGPSQKYIDRSEAFLKEPPPDAWDGVYNLTEK
ncbi:MAG: adenylate/guanylate cyclase domain-containing protein [Treponema sp.]|jgi:adenylate cyclase|nr:adenylate/guanylate cyclase domain-containing protein [Treponema sp.]